MGDPVPGNARAPGSMFLRALVSTRFMGILTLVLVSLAWENTIVLAGLLVLQSVLILVVKRKLEDLLLLIACALLGGAMEIVAVSFGAWHYAKSDLLGIPIWSPIGWGLAAIYFKNISLRIEAWLRTKDSV